MEDATYQLTFHGEDLNDRFPFQRVPEGRHIVRGELKDSEGNVVKGFDWPATIEDDCLYPADVRLVDGEPVVIEPSQLMSVKREIHE